MKGCGRQFCPVCRDELIHRDRRHAGESSSTFGQVCHRELPRDFSLADLDAVIRLWLGLRDGRTLMRLCEHKQPGAKFAEPQKQILRDLALVLGFARDHPESPIRLHPDSGVFTIYGHLDAEAGGRRKTVLAGPQRVYRLERTDGDWRQVLVATIRSYQELHAWLTAGLAKTQPSWWPLRSAP